MLLGHLISFAYKQKNLMHQKPVYFVNIGFDYSNCRNYLNAHYVGLRHTYVTYSHILRSKQSDEHLYQG